MNLNKYHASGRLYTPDEARDRALKIFGERYVDKTGDRFPPKPYNGQRNAAKHAAR